MLSPDKVTHYWSNSGIMFGVPHLFPFLFPALLLACSLEGFQAAILVIIIFVESKLVDPSLLHFAFMYGLADLFFNISCDRLAFAS